MLPGYGKKIALAVVGAFGLGIVGGVLTSGHQPSGTMFAGFAVILVSSIMWIWACLLIAQAKEKSSNWCMMGLLGLIGVIVMFCLPQASKDKTG